MTTTWYMVALIVGCAVVTWLPRILPFILVKNVVLPEVVLKWLSFIPICILSALVIEGLFEKEGELVLLNWHNVFALVPTLIVAVWSKSLSVTVVAGVVMMACIRLFT